MKKPLIILSDSSNDRDVTPTRAIEGHIVGVRSASFCDELNIRNAPAFELVIPVGAHVLLIKTVALEPILDYMKSIASIDVAPYVQFRFVGEELTAKRYTILQVAWNFVHEKFEKRSKFTPQSPVPFTGPVV